MIFHFCHNQANVEIPREPYATCHDAYDMTSVLAIQSAVESIKPISKTLNPKPYILNPEPSTLNPKPQTLTLSPKPYCKP